jgi:hypothetical protein
MSMIVAWAVNILQLSVKYRWPQVVGDCGKCNKYFATLGKIPTDGFLILDVSICGKCNKYFATLCKILMEGFCQYGS